MGAIREPIGLPATEPAFRPVTQDVPKRPARWTAAVAVIAVAVAAVMFGVQFVSADPPIAASPSAVAAGGMAATAVATYFSGPEADRETMFGEVATRDDSFYVTGARTVMLSQESEVWQATVAVELLTRVPSGYAPAGLHHYQISLRPTANGWQVTGPPGLVAAPTVAPAMIEWDTVADEAIARATVARLTSLAEAVEVLRTGQRGDIEVVEVEVIVAGHGQTLVYEVRASGSEFLISGVG